MKLSVICPTYNEIEFVEKLVNSLLEMPPLDKEILIIDGMSNDGTREILEDYQEKGKIRLFSNPDRTVPYALNIGIKNAKGDIISRVDAHSKYAADYFEKILETFNKVEADIVGGPTRVDYKNKFQMLIGLAMSSSFGIGNSLVHKSDYEGYSDSVTFGAWKKEIFQKTGFFDESLKRNQDDEFHYRAKNIGYKIYQNPEIKLWYYPRDTLSGLFKQYYQYGFYKPLVLLKIKSETKARHLIPSFFVLYLILLLPLSLMSWIFLIPACIYLILDVFVSMRTPKISLFSRLILLLTFPTIHIAYGSGFILGFIKRMSI